MMNEVESAEGKEMILAGERMWVEAQWAGDMQDAIRRVRELHKPVAGIGVTVCAVCVDDMMYWTEQVEYPCDTIKALDGEQ